MITHRYSIIVILFLFCSIVTYGQDENFRVNLKAGIDFAGFSDSPAEISPDHESGYRFGLDFRLGGGFLFFQPGLFVTTYQESFSVDQTAINPLDPPVQEIKLATVKVPVQLGFRIINSKPLVLRGSFGAVANIPVNITETNNQVAIDSEDYKNAVVAGVFGAGVDLLFFTFDVNYEFGLSNYIEFETPNIEAVNSKQSVLSLAVGIRF